MRDFIRSVFFASVTHFGRAADLSPSFLLLSAPFQRISTTSLAYPYPCFCAGTSFSEGSHLQAVSPWSPAPHLSHDGHPTGSPFVYLFDSVVVLLLSQSPLGLATRQRPRSISVRWGTPSRPVTGFRDRVIQRLVFHPLLATSFWTVPHDVSFVFPAFSSSV